MDSEEKPLLYVESSTLTVWSCADASRPDIRLVAENNVTAYVDLRFQPAFECEVYKGTVNSTSRGVSHLNA